LERLGDDDNGNVIEESLRDETPPDERSMVPSVA
jgi:hypothetical protein